MRIINFFQNCLSRRSFQFLSLMGFIIVFLPTLFWQLYSKVIYTGNNIYLDAEPVVFISILLLLPTIGLVSILSIFAMYLKLFIRECKRPEYRLTNKFLTTNPIYGFFVFVFYLFAIISLSILLYMATLHLEIYDEVFKYPIYLYPFLFYCLINILIVFKV